MTSNFMPEFGLSSSTVSPADKYSHGSKTFLKNKHKHDVITNKKRRRKSLRR